MLHQGDNSSAPSPLSLPLFPFFGYTLTIFDERKISVSIPNSSTNSKSFQKSLNNILLLLVLCIISHWCEKLEISYKYALEHTFHSMNEIWCTTKTKQAYYEHCLEHTHSLTHSQPDSPEIDYLKAFSCIRCFSHNHYYRYCYCFLHWQCLRSIFHSCVVNVDPWTLGACFDWIFHAMQSNYTKQAAKCFLFWSDFLRICNLISHTSASCCSISMLPLCMALLANSLDRMTNCKQFSAFCPPHFIAFRKTLVPHSIKYLIVIDVFNGLLSNNSCQQLFLLTQNTQPTKQLLIFHPPPIPFPFPRLCLRRHAFLKSHEKFIHGNSCTILRIQRVIKIIDFSDSAHFKEEKYRFRISTKQNTLYLEIKRIYFK